jgi:hypothetical protein
VRPEPSFQNLYHQDLLEIPFEKKAFDIISMWHVLEHLIDPERYVARTHEMLSDKGRFIVEVPNFDSWTRKLTGQYWLGLDPKHHIHFFTLNSLVGWWCVPHVFIFALLTPLCFIINILLYFSKYGEVLLISAEK